jgi:hypothetical protein
MCPITGDKLGDVTSRAFLGKVMISWEISRTFLRGPASYSPYYLQTIILFSVDYSPRPQPSRSTLSPKWERAAVSTFFMRLWLG